MRALTVTPGEPDSLTLRVWKESDEAEGSVVVSPYWVGVCGTDRALALGHHGRPPPDERQLVIGHEAVGRVRSAPSGGDLRVGDWVVGVVRRPDPVPCANCSRGEPDMCSNGRFHECGIRGQHGFARDLYRLPLEYAVRVPSDLGPLGVLVEPASILCKAWERIDHMSPQLSRRGRLLVVGAGPVGLLAALIGKQRNFEVHVVDRIRHGAKPSLVHRLGAFYHVDLDVWTRLRWDIIFECTGATELLFELIRAAGPNGVISLIGLPGHSEVHEEAATTHREWVLENNVVLGSVSANRSHYEQAVRALTAADRSWLSDLITRRTPLDAWPRAFVDDATQVKAVLEFSR